MRRGVAALRCFPARRRNASSPFRRGPRRLPAGESPLRPVTPAPRLARMTVGRAPERAVAAARPDAAPAPLKPRSAARAAARLRSGKRDASARRRAPRISIRPRNGFDGPANSARGSFPATGSHSRTQSRTEWKPGEGPLSFPARSAGRPREGPLAPLRQQRRQSVGCGVSNRAATGEGGGTRGRVEPSSRSLFATAPLRSAAELPARPFRRCAERLSQLSAALSLVRASSPEPPLGTVRRPRALARQFDRA